MKIQNPKPKIENKSFTLVEMLVAVGIFSVIMVIASTVIVSAIKNQRKALAMQELIDQTSYAMEYMSRALRMAKKELTCSNPANPLTCSCLTGSGYGYGYNYQLTRSGRGIKFINSKEDCQEFFWATDNSLREIKNGGVSVPLISPSLTVARFSIGPGPTIRGWSQAASCEIVYMQPLVNCQPRVTIYLDIDGKEGNNIKIQTTVSQRDLDVVY